MQPTKTLKDLWYKDSNVSFISKYFPGFMVAYSNVYLSAYSDILNAEAVSLSNVLRLESKDDKIKAFKDWYTDRIRKMMKVYMRDMSDFRNMEEKRSFKTVMQRDSYVYSYTGTLQKHNSELATNISGPTGVRILHAINNAMVNEGMTVEEALNIKEIKDLMPNLKVVKLDRTKALSKIFKRRKRLGVPLQVYGKADTVFTNYYYISYPTADGVHRDPYALAL